MAALDMDGQSETNKSPASKQHAGLFLEGASSPSHKKRHCLSAMSPFGVPGRTRTFLPKFQEISKRFKLLNINSLIQNQTCRHIS
jgi:hypothetical protein